MAIPTRPLGSSGLNITKVGFGSWAVGGGGWSFGWGPQDDSNSMASILHAVDQGINWIDTAAVYGLGHSEEVVGRVLREIPVSSRPYVFTKCGLIWNDNDRMKEPSRVLNLPLFVANGWRRRSAAWVLNVSISINFTGRMTLERQSKSLGPKWPIW